MATNPEHKEALLLFNKNLKEAVKTKKVIIAKYKGKRMRAKSGKISWTSLQAAKLAIRLTLSHNYYIRGYNSNEEVKKLEDNGLITYEEIEEVHGSFK